MSHSQVSVPAIVNTNTIAPTYKTTAAGFEPARAEPSGFRVHLLNHSDKLPCNLTPLPSS